MNELKIEKRDGRKVYFDENKIVEAMEKAYTAVRDHASENDRSKFIAFAKSTASTIKNTAQLNDACYTVENIQDLVENALLSDEEYKDIAVAYIRYRESRTIERQKHTKLYKKVKEKLSASNVQNQNANVDEHSFGGRKGEADSIILKEIALNSRMSEKSRRNHIENRIYVHDLDSYELGEHNCLSIPFDDLLANGFNTRQTDVRPARSVNTAFQLIAVLFQLQSLCQFGGVSATHIDHTMVPYVRMSFIKHYKDGQKYISGTEPIELSTVEAAKIPIEIGNGVYTDDKAYRYAMDMTVKEIYQAVEGMYHNLNTLQSRSGNQLPFSSINYGTCTLSEGRLITKALLDTSIEGIGKLNRTSIFPCGIFQYSKDWNAKPGTPNYDLKKLAIKSTCRRLYPNYCNIDWSGNEGYDKNDPRTYFSTMGCRTANTWDINGFGQLKDGRGNICPVTIILPTLAMEARDQAYTKGTDPVDEFMEILDDAIHDAKDMLIERFDWICSQDPSSAKFMWENNMMKGYNPEEGIRSAMKHGTLALGQLGLAECLQALIGTDHTTKEGMDLAKKIESLFSQRCNEFKHEYNLNFGVYYSPSENLCYTAMTKFRNKYGIIKNISDHEYMTNSMHIPVWQQVSPFEKIDLESQLTGYSRAGCITYVELDDGAIHNEDAVEQIIDYAMDHDIPYFAINVPNDMCMECGYTGLINSTCPKCGSNNISRLRRVTGYLTGNYTTAFNKGKQAEVRDRYQHSKKLSNWNK